MEVKKTWISQLVSICLLTFILFFPTKYFSIYYIVIIVLSCIYFFISKFKIEKTFYLSVFLVIVSFIFINSILASIFLSSSFERNFTEVLRFLPIIILLANYKYVNIKYKSIFLIFSLYASIGTIVNFLQFNKSSIVQGITSFYNDPLQVESSLEIANRSLGLSAGPGPNGIIFMILSIFFLISLLNNQYKSISIIMMLFCISSIFFSQSQTAFVGLALAIFIVLFLWAIKNINNKKLYIYLPVILSIFLFSFYYVLTFIEDFKYLNTLFDQGLERNSYKNREIKFDSTIDVIINNPFFLFLGHGKDYIPSSTALDNEYLFFISVYGVLVTFLFFIFYFYNTILLFLSKNNSIFKFLIIATCLVGMVVAWPSSFLLDPRVFFILVFYMICYMQEKAKV